MSNSSYISSIKKELIEIKNKLNNVDIYLITQRDPDCIFQEKPYYDSLYYCNIKPDETAIHIQKTQSIYNEITAIIDKHELRYLLDEIIQLKESAKRADETFHYPVFVELYCLFCKIEEYIEISIGDSNCGYEHEDPILSQDQYMQLKDKFIDNMDYKTLVYVIKHKQLPEGGKKGIWKNRPVEAARFCEITGIGITGEWNKCFRFNNSERKLKCNDKPGADQPDTGDVNKIFTD